MEVSIKSLEETIEQMKQEILQDVRSGRVPVTVESFNVLHDYVDANCYGGFCEDVFADALIDHFGGRDEHEGMPDGMLKYINDAQNSIHSWIANGSLKH